MRWPWIPERTHVLKIDASSKVRRGLHSIHAYIYIYIYIYINIYIYMYIYIYRNIYIRQGPGFPVPPPLPPRGGRGNWGHRKSKLCLWNLSFWTAPGLLLKKSKTFLWMRALGNRSPVHNPTDPTTNPRPPQSHRGERGATHTQVPLPP